MKKMDDKPKIDLEGKVSSAWSLRALARRKSVNDFDFFARQITDAFKVFDSDGSGMITGENPVDQWKAHSVGKWQLSCSNDTATCARTHTPCPGN